MKRFPRSDQNTYPGGMFQQCSDKTWFRQQMFIIIEYQQNIAVSEKIQNMRLCISLCRQFNSQCIGNVAWQSVRSFDSVKWYPINAILKGKKLVLPHVQRKAGFTNTTRNRRSLPCGDFLFANTQWFAEFPSTPDKGGTKWGQIIEWYALLLRGNWLSKIFWYNCTVSGWGSTPNSSCKIRQHFWYCLRAALRCEFCDSKCINRTCEIFPATHPWIPIGAHTWWLFDIHDVWDGILPICLWYR